MAILLLLLTLAMGAESPPEPRLTPAAQARLRRNREILEANAAQARQNVEAAKHNLSVLESERQELEALDREYQALEAKYEAYLKQAERELARNEKALAQSKDSETKERQEWKAATEKKVTEVRGLLRQALAKRREIEVRRSPLQENIRSWRGRLEEYERLAADFERKRSETAGN